MIKLLISFFLMISFYADAQHVCAHKHQCNSLLRNTNSRSDSANVLRYNVSLDLSSGGFLGGCEIAFKAIQNLSTLSLDLLKLSVDSVIQNQNLLDFSYNDTLLVIDVEDMVEGDSASVLVYYSGNPQGDASGWGGWYNVANYTFNLGVGFAADPHNYGRIWHPCFDNFVERAQYLITVSSDTTKYAYAVGLLESDTVFDNKRHRTWRMDEEIPTYLCAVHLASYTHVSQVYNSVLNGDNIPIELIAVPADTNGMKASFVHLKDAMESFELGYGPYKWSKIGYALVPFNGGAMEHATCISYPRSSATGSLSSETLMAHELSHHWWGNLITCRTQEDMWINEGWASYSERLFLEYVYGWQAYIDDIKANHLDVIHHAHIDDDGARALHGVPHAYTYGSHSYNKGADVAHNLRAYLGDSAFFDVIPKLMNAFSYKDIDAYDFRDFLLGQGYSNMTDFFANWVFSPGFVQVGVDSVQITPIGNTFEARVYLQQKLRMAPAYYGNVPVEITFVNSNWEKYTTKVSMSGQYADFLTSVPFEPVFWYVNDSDKLSQACTGENFKVSSNITKDLSYSLMRLVVNNVVDSALFRLEHNWVAPDPIKNIEMAWMYSLSTDRYWRVEGVDLDKTQGKFRFFLNAKDNGAGNLDVTLFQLPGFFEDSVKLMYRRNAADDWRPMHNVNYNSFGNQTDGYAYFETDSIRPGEYTFALKKSSLQVPFGKTELFSVYPNPVKNNIVVDLSNLPRNEYDIVITDALGKVCEKIQTNQTSLQISMARLPPGNYAVAVLEKSRYVGFKQLIKL